MSDDDLSEVYLVVRAEERPAVELALEGLLPALHSSFPAVGRGRGGGLRSQRPARFWPFGRPPAGEFLPKIVFYLVVPSSMVDDLVRAVTAAVCAERGDAEHGLGVVFVSPILRETAIVGARPARSAAEVSP